MSFVTTVGGLGSANGGVEHARLVFQINKPVVISLKVYICLTSSSL